MSRRLRWGICFFSVPKSNMKIRKSKNNLFRKIEKNKKKIQRNIFTFLWKLRVLRPAVYRIMIFIEGGTMFSPSLRKILKKYYCISVGDFSYGASLKPGTMPSGTCIGNYCSLAPGLIIHRRNHPYERVSTHPLFYNHKIGFVNKDTIDLVADNPLKIGHDVWIGENVIILPNCTEIGNGAILAAGSVVTRDVPSYAVVGGIPAKLIKWRFEKSVCRYIEESQWWTKTPLELFEKLAFFQKKVDEKFAQKFSITISKK